jgi:hypothetical protein
VLPKASDDLFAGLDGEVGDAVGFVGRMRNMAVHPGALVREPVRPDLCDKQQMAQTYEIIDGIVALAFGCLANQVRTLEPRRPRLVKIALRFWATARSWGICGIGQDRLVHSTPIAAGHDGPALRRGNGL